MSGLLVVDIDPGHGGKADGFPETTTVSATGGGGQHLFYQIPNEGYGSYTGPEGIDIRCEGGFVVAPPSIHKTGNAYVWDPDEDLGTIDINTLKRLAPRKNEVPGWGDVWVRSLLIVFARKLSVKRPKMQFPSPQPSPRGRGSAQVYPLPLGEGGERSEPGEGRFSPAL